VPSAWQKKCFVNRLHAGGVVAYPTEAVFGLGCDPLNREAVNHLFDLKGRSEDKGLILIASKLSQLSPYIQPLNEPLLSVINEPGEQPTTWLLPAKQGVPDWLTGGRDKIAIRLIRHALAKELCELADMAIVSTSANKSGCLPTKTANQTRLKFSKKDVYTINGQVGSSRSPSRIIDPVLNIRLR